MRQGLGKVVVYVSGKGMDHVEIIMIAIRERPQCLAISVCTGVAGGQCDSLALTMSSTVCKMVYGHACSLVGMLWKQMWAMWKMTSLRQPPLRMCKHHRYNSHLLLNITVSVSVQV